MKQYLYFQLNADTLGADSNVAGTAKAGTRVIVALRRPLKRLFDQTKKCAAENGALPAQAMNRESRIPPSIFEK
jgi:hypothetical protein